MIDIFEAKDPKKDRVYSLDELINTYDYDASLFERMKKCLVCPCCDADVLNVDVNQHHAFITTKRSEHEKTCDYYGFNITQQEVKKRIRQGIGFDDLIDNLDVKKKLPKRSFDRRFTEDDLKMYKLFYGTALVKRAYSKDSERFINYSFKSKLGDSFVVSLQTKQFKEDDKLIKYLEANVDKEITMKVIGNLDHIDNYYNILLKHPSLFYIEEPNVWKI